MSHIILLMQMSAHPDTRTFRIYETVQQCIDGVFKMYEEFLWRRSNSATIIYTLSELFSYVDTLYNLRCLVYHKSSNNYVPYDKAWIKEMINVMFRNAIRRAREC